ncbi:hypothetical protein JW960_15135, partial [candidate division KSB1 bacterium]|nr:hypothetical protein [candidate division KSB1 bacterium]
GCIKSLVKLHPERSRRMITYDKTTCFDFAQHEEIIRILTFDTAPNIKQLFGFSHSPNIIKGLKPGYFLLVSTTP